MVASCVNLFVVRKRGHQAPFFISSIRSRPNRTQPTSFRGARSTHGTIQSVDVPSFFVELFIFESLSTRLQLRQCGKLHFANVFWQPHFWVFLHKKPIQNLPLIAFLATRVEDRDLHLSRRKLRPPKWAQSRVSWPHDGPDLLRSSQMLFTIVIAIPAHAR